MKADIHPEYGPVLFRDLASGKVFLTRSTMTSAKTEKWEVPHCRGRDFLRISPVLHW